MARRRGRKLKPGKRTKSGQLSRAKVDRGNHFAESRQIRFGNDGTDAIGRAFAAGLLGSGQDAKTMLDTARAIYRAYWAAYTNGPIRCTLADRTSGAATLRDDDREVKQEAWLNAMLGVRDAADHGARVLFDNLVIDPNPDQGPPWLDRIIRNPTQASATDRQRLEAAQAILARCSGVEAVEMKDCA